MSATGVKLDGGKPRLSLLPWAAVLVVVEVLEFGARKYAADNWRHVPDARRRYFDAAMRHLTAWWSGERADHETGLSHLAHAACCLLFLLALELEGSGGGGHERAPEAQPLLSPVRPTPPAGVAPPAPSRGPRSPAAVRAARFYFERRARQWSAVPAGETWEGWLATPEGVAWLGATAPCNACNASDATPATPPFPPSHSPLSPEFPEVLEEDAREVATATPATGNGNACNAPMQRPDATPATRCLVEILCDASGQRVSPWMSLDDRRALTDALVAVGLGREEEVRRFGEAMQGDGAARLWPKSEPAKGRRALTAGFFLGRDGRARMLADGVTRWRESLERAAAPAPATVRVVSAAELEAQRAASVEAFKASAAARGALPRPAIFEGRR